VQAKLIDLLTRAKAAFQSKDFVEAETLVNKALKIDARSPDAHMTMGIIMASTGRLNEAIKHFKAVLREQPQSAQVRANLATALYEQEAYKEAIAEFEKTLKADPSLIKARLTYASALRKATHLDKAIQEYQQILSRYPQSHEALNGIGLTYMSKDMEDECLNAFHRATQIAPTIAEYHLNFAIALDVFNYLEYARIQYDEALKIQPYWIVAKKHLLENLFRTKALARAEEIMLEALKDHPKDVDLINFEAKIHREKLEYHEANLCIDRALQLEPSNPHARLLKARILAEQGNFSDAISVYENLINDEPGFLPSYVPYSRVKKFSLDDPFLPKLEKMVFENERLLSQETINFALGKIYDDCKEWDKAFLHYKKANILTNRFKRYNQDEDKKGFDAVITYFTEENIKKLHRFKVGQKFPILIIGMPRSGTTLIEDVIARHSKVEPAGELGFWREAISSVSVVDANLGFPESISKLTKDDAERLVSKYIETLKSHINENSNCTFVTDKMPHNFLWLGAIAGLFPEMPIIHCKREPMDNCLSIYFQTFEGEHSYAYDLENLGFHYKQYERLMSHWHQVLPGRILDVQYEDLVADPEYWTRKMIEHVGLQWEDGCLEQQESDRTVKTASIWQVRQPIYKTSVKRWKHYEKHLGPLKEALSYEESQ
jgi:tetratricopeptide (TPR) repeat protein